MWRNEISTGIGGIKLINIVTKINFVCEIEEFKENL